MGQQVEKTLLPEKKTEMLFPALILSLLSAVCSNTILKPSHAVPCRVQIFGLYAMSFMLVRMLS